MNLGGSRSVVPATAILLLTVALLAVGPLAVRTPHSGATVRDPEPGTGAPVVAPGDRIREELWVVTQVDSDRDGLRDRVRIVVTRPRPADVGGRKLATVYSISPYAAGFNEVRFHDVDHALWHPKRARPRSTRRAHGHRGWVRRGYATVRAQSLGTGRSTGCPTVGDEQETAGAKAVVDWLNGRAVARDADNRKVRARWATGSVGMVGTSYDGTLPNAVAATGVEGLDAIIPVSAISRWYDYYRANGLVVAPGGYQGEDADVLAKFVHTRADRAVCKPVIRKLARRQDRRTGDNSRFWNRRNYLKDAADVRAAVLVAHGLRDWNVKPGQAGRWYEALTAAGVDRMIYWHQGGHGGDPPRRLMRRWFDHYLYGADNGVDTEPHALVEREDGDLVQYAEWPDPAALDTQFHLAPRGRGQYGELTAGPVSEHTERFVDVPTLTPRKLLRTRETRHGLAYRSAPLGSDVRLSGTPRATLELASRQRAANVTVALVDLRPDGKVGRLVTQGWADPQNRSSAWRTDPIEPRQFYQLDVPLEANDYVFGSGHRIALVVMSTDRDHTIRPPAGNVLRLRLAGSSLSIPLVVVPATGNP